jgi:uncharacterized protein (TIGR02757 family)
MKQSDLRELLDEAYRKYARPEFLELDPISLPARLDKLQDREIIGFWVAMLAWGNRKSIIASGERLLDFMDGAPHDFVLNHKDSDLKPFLDFKHRTFNSTDALYFLDFFRRWYSEHDSLEEAFTIGWSPEDEDVGPALIAFEELFRDSEDFPRRTMKHVASPARKSSCKRLNMFLRWMVRGTQEGVDFGLWKTIKAGQLVCPLDVHVERVARRYRLLKRKQRDWQAASELTAKLRKLDPEDPVKYDFALFGIGVLEKAGAG